MLKRLASSMIAIGVALFVLAGLALLHAAVGSGIALAQFDASRQPSAAGADSVDTSLWSEGRVAAFREAIGMRGDPPLAVLRIPRVGLETPVFRGTDDVTLNRGAGWIEGTAAPGSKGNAGIAAHRDGFFRALKDIAGGDVIELETADGVQRYEVRSISIVEPTDVSPLAQGGERALTLVTCHPFYFVGPAPNRFIVRATSLDATAAGTTQGVLGTTQGNTAVSRDGD